MILRPPSSPCTDTRCPSTTLFRSLPSGVNFARRREARPGLTQLLATLLSHAPALAEQLGRRPELLDGLIDSSALEPARPVEALAKDFARADRADEDYQWLLDRVRRRVNGARFALGVQLVAARRDPLEVARGYASVDEGALRVVADATVRELEAGNGRIRESEPLNHGHGRVGGMALYSATNSKL